MRKLFFILFFLFGAFGAQAQCECDLPESTEAAIEEADLIFVGEAVNLQTNWMSGGWKIAFQVDSTWKKTNGSMSVVHTDWAHECGYEFELGKKYLVYASKKRSVKTHRCSGTKLLSEASEDLSLLGKGLATQMNPNAVRSTIILSLLTLAGIVFIVFVALRNRRKH